VSAWPDQHQALARRSNADLWSGRSHSEQRDPVFRGGIKHNRALPDARDRSSVEYRNGREAAVRATEVPAVSRARGDSERAANGESGARSADGARSPAARMDPGMAEEAVRHSAGNANAGILARLSEVVVPAAQRSREGAGPRDSRSSAHVQRWSDAPAEWHCGCKRELNPRQDWREGREREGRRKPATHP